MLGEMLSHGGFPVRSLPVLATVLFALLVVGCRTPPPPPPPDPGGVSVRAPLVDVQVRDVGR